MKSFLLLVSGETFEDMEANMNEAFKEFKSEPGNALPSLKVVY